MTFHFVVVKQARIDDHILHEVRHIVASYSLTLSARLNVFHLLFSKGFPVLTFEPDNQSAS